MLFSDDFPYPDGDLVAQGRWEASELGDDSPQVVSHAVQAVSATEDVAARHGARLLRPESGHGPNAARNTGIRAARAELVALVDDDVYAPPSWLAAMTEGATRHPEADALGGPIRARLEGPAPRGCGREDPPITSLDLGPADREVELVWSANMALRRAAFERVGPLDERFSTGGDEEEWLHRLRASGGRVVYVAAAALDHRRAGDDARHRLGSPPVAIVNQP